MVNFPGCLPGYDFYTVKINVKTPGNALAGLPFLMGTITLIDRKTGQPMALLESGLITAMRTGAAGAIGVEACGIIYNKAISLNMGTWVEGL